MNPSLLRALPLIVLLLFSTLLALGLFKQPPRQKPDMSSAVGFHIGAFDLPVLGSETARFTPDLWKGKIAVVNVFASWCEPCAAEHASLMKLANSGKVAIYGIAWKDTPEKTAAWLTARGNPYQVIGLDVDGKSTLPLALSGVPETFVVNPNGNIVYHYKSALTDALVDGTVLPLVERLQQDYAQ